jgi:hypothetical protein
MASFFAEIRFNVLDFEIQAAAFIVVFQFFEFFLGHLELRC